MINRNMVQVETSCLVPNKAHVFQDSNFYFSKIEQLKKRYLYCKN